MVKVFVYSGCSGFIEESLQLLCRDGLHFLLNCQTDFKAKPPSENILEH